MPLDPRADDGVYAISVAAQLAGVAPQTLRLYEEKGLLAPARTDGGTRRYSRQDLDRVAEITTLTAGGLTIEGIKRLFEMQTETLSLRAQVARLRQQLSEQRNH